MGDIHHPRYPGFVDLDIAGLGQGRAMSVAEIRATAGQFKSKGKEPFPEGFTADDDAFDPWIECGLMEAPPGWRGQPDN